MTHRHPGAPGDGGVPVYSPRAAAVRRALEGQSPAPYLIATKSPELREDDRPAKSRGLQGACQSRPVTPPHAPSRPLSRPVTLPVVCQSVVFVGRSGRQRRGLPTSHQMNIYMPLRVQLGADEGRVADMADDPHTHWTWRELLPLPVKFFAAVLPVGCFLMLLHVSCELCL